MRQRDVVGRKIVHVEQEITQTRDDGQRENTVEYIELDNGTRLWPVTIETDYGLYLHTFTVTNPKWNTYR